MQDSQLLFELIDVTDDHLVYWHFHLSSPRFDDMLALKLCIGNQNAEKQAATPDTRIIPEFRKVRGTETKVRSGRFSSYGNPKAGVTPPTGYRSWA